MILGPEPYPGGVPSRVIKEAENLVRSPNPNLYPLWFLAIVLVSNNIDLEVDLLEAYKKNAAESPALYVMYRLIASMSKEKQSFFLSDMDLLLGLEKYTNTKLPPTPTLDRGESFKAYQQSIEVSLWAFVALAATGRKIEEFPEAIKNILNALVNAQCKKIERLICEISQTEQPEQPEQTQRRRRILLEILSSLQPLQPLVDLNNNYNLLVESYKEELKEMIVSAWPTKQEITAYDNSIVDFLEALEIALRLGINHFPQNAEAADNMKSMLNLLVGEISNHIKKLKDGLSSEYVIIHNIRLALRLVLGNYFQKETLEETLNLLKKLMDNSFFYSKYKKELLLGVLEDLGIDDFRGLLNSAGEEFKKKVIKIIRSIIRGNNPDNPEYKARLLLLLLQSIKENPQG